VQNVVGFAAASKRNLLLQNAFSLPIPLATASRKPNQNIKSTASC